MGNVRFIRLAEVVNKKQDKRVVSVTVVPTITDCSGTIYFTDLQLQEGSALTGYAPHTMTAPAWFNGIVRSEETVILLNLGGTSAGLDIHLYPKQRMEGGSVTLAQGVGGQKATFPNAMNAGDDVALLASTRECTRNGSAEKKDGLKGKKIMVWTFMGNTRMYNALRDYGDRISQIGLFSFKVRATGEIYESGVAISNMLTYINRYPHINWLLTVANDGTNSIFRALRDNTNGAQDMFLSELVRIMQKYPWCDGVDIDLEKG